MSRRDTAKDYIERLLNPKSDETISIVDVRYWWNQMQEINEELLGRLPVQVGDQVKLIKDLEIEEGHEWYSSRHFLKTWNVGTVTDIAFIKNKQICYYVKWHNQSWISSWGDDKGKETPYEEEYKKLYCHSERELIKHEPNPEIKDIKSFMNMSVKDVFDKLGFKED